MGNLDEEVTERMAWDGDGSGITVCGLAVAECSIGFGYMDIGGLVYGLSCRLFIFAC